MMAITQTREIQNPAYGLAVFFKIKKEENLERVIVLLYLHSLMKIWEICSVGLEHPDVQSGGFAGQNPFPLKFLKILGV